jgi:hypothetical protein
MSHWIYDWLLNFMGIHLLRCVHGGERTTSHKVVQNVFMAIAKDVGFHISQEHTHVLHPLPCNLRTLELIMCYHLMVSARWKMLSLLTTLELTWFCELFFLMGLV